jgi:hypothetical protein
MKKKAWNWGGDWILKQKAEQLFIIMHVSKEVSELCTYWYDYRYIAVEEV